MFAGPQERFRAEQSASFLDFIDILKELWDKAGKPGDIIRFKNNDKAEYPVITYRLLGRAINEKMKEIKPRLRETIEHPEIPGQWIEIYGQTFDIYVEFTVHALSAEEADELVIELEKFLFMYLGYFKQKGVKEILFDSQKPDVIDSSNRYSVHKRTLVYQVIIEHLIPYFLNQLRDINIQANILKYDE